MKRYQSHKIVHAGRIAFPVIPAGNLPNGVDQVEIALRVGDEGPLHDFPGAAPAEITYERVMVGREWLARHNPRAGGYFVQYEDGYQSYSPAEAFRNGYTELREGAAASEGLLALVFGFGEALPQKVDREWLRGQIRNCAFEVRGDGRTTLCELTLFNGATYRGESSCAVEAEFNARLGEDKAYEKALDSVWSAYGFLLRELRFRAGVLDQTPSAAATAHRRPVPGKGAPKPAGHNPVA